MSENAGWSDTVRFQPEVRGWAALRLVGGLPRPLRETLRRFSHPPIPPHRPDATLSRGLLAGTALTLVSTPEAVAWSRMLSERVPAFGIAAGPACMARVWVGQLLRPGGAIDVFWPDAADSVWCVVKPILTKLGLEVRGWHREELWHEVAAPLALMFLKSVAAGRKDLRLVDMGPPDRPEGPRVRRVDGVRCRPVPTVRGAAGPPERPASAGAAGARDSTPCDSGNFRRGTASNDLVRVDVVGAGRPPGGRRD
jgi:hypothetical protein